MEKYKINIYITQPKDVEIESGLLANKRTITYFKTTSQPAQ